MTAPAILRGRTELVEDGARIAAAYLPVEEDDHRNIGGPAIIVSALLYAALIIGVPVLCRVAV